MSRHLKRGSRIALVAAGAMLFAVGFGARAYAELLKVDQTVYGMDCAPCAFGVERGLRDLPGVTHVTVSLNDAKAVVALAPENTVTLDQIQRVIRHGGFDAREAEIEVRGRFLPRSQGTGPSLVLESGERFTLRRASAPDKAKRDEASKSAWRRIERLNEGQIITVKGVAPREEKGGEGGRGVLTLHVEHVE